jgi:type I restriction enzyme S subunit
VGFEVPYIKVYNLKFDGSLDFSINPTFVEKLVHEKQLARSIVYPGDVLMNIVGPPLGKVSIVPDDYPEWNMNQAVSVFRPLGSVVNKYLSFCLLSSNLLDFVKMQAKATVGQFNLTLEICRNYPIPLPPIEEQKEIVSQVEALLTKADKVEKQYLDAKAKLDRLNQSILAKAFRGELVSQDPKDEPAEVLLKNIKSEMPKAKVKPKK